MHYWGSCLRGCVSGRRGEESRARCAEGGDVRSWVQCFGWAAASRVSLLDERCRAVSWLGVIGEHPLDSHAEHRASSPVPPLRPPAQESPTNGIPGAPPPKQIRPYSAPRITTHVSPTETPTRPVPPFLTAHAPRLPSNADKRAVAHDLYHCVFLLGASRASTPHVEFRRSLGLHRR